MLTECNIFGSETKQKSKQLGNNAIQFGPTKRIAEIEGEQDMRHEKFVIYTFFA